MLTSGKPSSLAAQEPPAASSAEGGTILIVDDEPIICRMVTNILQHFGFRVLSAENGQHALDVLRTSTEPIDVMILDLSMPVMNGYSALEHIRQIRPELRVVISSGLDEANVAESFASLPVAGFIQKPYNVQILVSTVKRLMSGVPKVAGYAA